MFHAAGGETIRRSYRQVWKASAQVARALVAGGFCRNRRVGLLVANRPEWVTPMFGIVLAGIPGVKPGRAAGGPHADRQSCHSDSIGTPGRTSLFI